MNGVTYYVALPFATGDDGPVPREAVECTSANRRSCAPRISRDGKATSARSLSVEPAIRHWVSLPMHRYCGCSESFPA